MGTAGCSHEGSCFSAVFLCLFFEKQALAGSLPKTVKEQIRKLYSITKEIQEYQKNSYLIWRFMIDKNYQRKGYGRAAMQQALELVRSFPCGESEYCWISYEPENEAARNLYLSFGFEEKPEDYVEGEEMPAVMKL